MQVILSSSAHKRGNVQLDDLDFKKSGYNEWASYGQSKTANIWTALELERRYGSQGKRRFNVAARWLHTCPGMETLVLCQANFA